MKQLAIKGHPTRGKEVIEILEMLGGRNLHLQSGCGNGIYLINTCDNIIYFNQPKDIIYDFIILTLEEFLKKYPYKVGDKVTHSDYESPLEIVGMKWEDDSIKYEVYTNDYGYWFIVDELQPYKEETMEETKKKLDWHPTDYLEFVDNDEWADEVELNLGDSYEIQVRGGQTFAIKKQPQYPKTCEECLKILGKTMNSLDNMRGYKYALFMRLQQLLICRDAYWKIAGDWEEKRKEKAIHYVIYSTLLGEVVKDATPNYIANYLLDFPTAEMRDEFFENFKDLIERCKELL